MVGEFPQVFVSSALTCNEARSTSKSPEVTKFDNPGLSVFSPISRSDLVATQQEDPVWQSLFTAMVPPREAGECSEWLLYTGIIVVEEVE